MCIFWIFFDFRGALFGHKMALWERGRIHICGRHPLPSSKHLKLLVKGRQTPPNAADFLLWLAAPGAANKIAAEISTSALFIVPQIIVVALHNKYIFFKKILCSLWCKYLWWLCTMWVESPHATAAAVARHAAAAPAGGTKWPPLGGSNATWGSKCNQGCQMQLGRVKIQLGVSEVTWGQNFHTEPFSGHIMEKEGARGFYYFQNGTTDPCYRVPSGNHL